MQCPKCGRPLLSGEICQCQILKVAKRQDELNAIAADDEDSRISKRNDVIKNQSKSFENISNKANKAADTAMGFFNRYINYLKDIHNVDNFMDEGKTSDAVLFIFIHFILNTLLVYLSFSHSVIGAIFATLSAFSKRPGSAVFIGSAAISAIPLLLKCIPCLYKARNTWVREIASEYICTIPMTIIAIIFMLINKMAGMVMLLPIVTFGMVWSYRLYTKTYKMKETLAFLMVTAIALVMSIVSLIIIAMMA